MFCIMIRVTAYCHRAKMTSGVFMLVVFVQYNKASELFLIVDKGHLSNIP